MAFFRHINKSIVKRLLIAFGIIFLIALIWLATTDQERIGAYRNVALYQVQSRWWQIMGEPQSGAPGRLSGIIQDEAGSPIANAWVVVARWDGEKHLGRSSTGGHYQIEGIPAGKYHPLASAPGYADARLGRNGVAVQSGETTTADAVLAPEIGRTVSPGTDLAFGQSSQVSCTAPLEASAIRREVTFSSNGQPNLPARLYLPTNTTPDDQYPLLLIIYPGPVDSWQCASVPLADAGYAVMGLGPHYALDLQPDVDELERILGFAAAGLMPNVDQTNIAALGGSYSGLHIQHLLRRNRDDLKAAVLLGAPTDIFAMRKHLEDGTFIPPFGLDKVLVALGLPDREPERYWTNSGAYHVQPNFPPILVIHSRDDEVVPIDQSDLLTESLIEAGVPHQTHYFNEASHYLLSPSGEALEIYDITLAFLAEYLR